MTHSLRSGFSTIALVVLLVSPFRPSQAADRPLYFMTTNAVDTITLIPAPPIDGSFEDEADMAAVVFARNTCTSNELAIAMEFNHKQDAFNMAPFLGAYFQSDKLPKTAALLRHAQHDTAHFVAIGKDHWKRLRPLTVDTNLLVTSPDTSFSYPSGHSAGGMIVGLILMDLFPEQKEAILRASYNAGWHRVQIAKHFPSDIQAGRVLAFATYQAMKSNPRFQKELAEARTELAEAQAAAVPAER